MFEVMKTKSRKLLDYPDQTRWSKLAAEVRKKANGLSPEQRAEYYRKGMAMICGGDVNSVSISGRGVPLPLPQSHHASVLARLSTLDGLSQKLREAPLCIPP